MQKEIAAALKAAKAHKVRNEGERSSVELIIAMLQDASDRVPLLDGFAAEFDKQQRIIKAQAELNAAQSA